MKASVPILTVVLLACCTPAVSAIPQTLSYQGVLRDGSGNVVADGPYDVVFRIYDVETGGSPLWTETQSVNVADGVFNASLGTVSPLTLPFDAPYWLGMSVEAEPELSPRTKLAAAPYARRAQYADVADDGDWIVAGDDAYRAGGLIGVGTSSPLYDLDIQRNENATVGIQIKNTDTGSLSTEAILFTNEEGNLAGIVLNDDDHVYPNAMSIINNRQSGYIRLRTGGIDRLRVANDGKVGIGVSLPERLLHVGGTARFDGFEMIPGAGDGYVLTSDAAGVGTWQEPAAVADGDWTISGSDMSSAVSGNVGLGTSTPQDKLEVKGVLRLDAGAGNSNILRFVDGGTLKWALLYRPWVDGNLTVLDEVSLVRSMTFESGTGDVGVKTEHPESDLHVVGDVRVDGNLQVNGEITRSAATSYYTVQAQDFVSQYPTFTDYTQGGGLFTDSGASGSFVAPVHLPHGATVTSVTYHYVDYSSSDNSLILLRRPLSGTPSDDMATLSSSGSSGSGSATDSTIDYAAVDNTAYGYLVLLNSTDGIVTYGVVVEYTTTGVN